MHPKEHHFDFSILEEGNYPIIDGFVKDHAHAFPTQCWTCSLTGEPRYKPFLTEPPPRPSKRPTTVDRSSLKPKKRANSPQPADLAVRIPERVFPPITPGSCFFTSLKLLRGPVGPCSPPASERLLQAPRCGLPPQSFGRRPAAARPGRCWEGRGASWRD